MGYRVRIIKHVAGRQKTTVGHIVELPELGKSINLVEAEAGQDGFVTSPIHDIQKQRGVYALRTRSGSLYTVKVLEELK